MLPQWHPMPRSRPWRTHTPRHGPDATVSPAERLQEASDGHSSSNSQSQGHGGRRQPGEGTRGYRHTRAQGWRRCCWEFPAPSPSPAEPTGRQTDRQRPGELTAVVPKTPSTPPRWPSTPPSWPSTPPRQPHQALGWGRPRGSLRAVQRLRKPGSGAGREQIPAVPPQ